MITILIGIGTVVAMVPGLPVITLLIGVQVVNGALLPVTLFFVWRLASSRELMGVHANGHAFNVLAGLTVLATSFSLLAGLRPAKKIMSSCQRRSAACNAAFSVSYPPPAVADE